MPSTFEFCLPTKSTAVPDGPDWLHEIKYDGYRLRLERDDKRVRLITRGGYNWADRYPWIVEAALKNRHRIQTGPDSRPGFCQRVWTMAPISGSTFAKDGCRRSLAGRFGISTVSAKLLQVRQGTLTGVKSEGSTMK